MALYKITDIEFGIDNYKFQIANIVKSLAEYNHLMEISPFDTQFLSMQLLKYEARHSNLIEGIDTNNVEILSNDTQTSKKISNYVNALKFGNEQLIANDNFDVDLILNIHKRLFDDMMSIDAIHAVPGRFRTKFVKIGHHNPPDPNDVLTYIKEFVEWLNDETLFKNTDIETHAMIKAAIAHAYFEKIHPFTDGNGRVGRILFNLVLNKYKITKKPYFYISKAIIDDQFNYYQELQKLDHSKDFNRWIIFFLSLILKQIKFNIETFDKATKLIFKLKTRIYSELDQEKRAFKKQVLSYITRYPVFTFTRVYFTVKPSFPNMSDGDFVKSFDEIIDEFHIIKVLDSKHYEFKSVVDIIVGNTY